MQVLSIFIILLSFSQAVFRRTGHHIRDEDGILQDFLNFHNSREQLYNDNEDEDDDDDDYKRYKFFDVLHSLKHDLEERHKRQPRIKSYENYNKDEDEGKIYNRKYKDILKSHQHSNEEKDVLVEKGAQKKDKILVKNKFKKGVAGKVLDKTKKLFNQDYKKLIDEDHKSKFVDVVKTKTISDDNDQIALVKVDDTIERQQALVNKIDPNDVFLEATSKNVTRNKTKIPTHAHVKAPPATLSTNKKNKEGLDKVSLIAVIAGCCIAGIAGIGLAGYCWFKLRGKSKSLNEFQHGVHVKEKKGSKRGSGKKASSEDEKLAESAEVFHYLHAKKQMQQMEEPLKKGEKYPAEEGSSDEEEDEDTVYECPGLAPPGDMKVVNPLFSDADSHHSDKQSDTVSHGGTPTQTDIESLSKDIKTPPPSE